MYLFVVRTINLPCIIFQLFTFNWGHKHQKQLLLLLQQQLQQELQHQQQNSDTHNRTTNRLAKYNRTASTGSTRILFSFYIYMHSPLTRSCSTLALSVLRAQLDDFNFCCYVVAGLISDFILFLAYFDNIFTLFRQILID